jgi:hypothetical protein
VLGDRGIAGIRRGGAERRAARVERDAVDAALRLVEGLSDAGDLLLGDDVGRDAGLERGEARVVRLLERLEGAGELVEGCRHLGGLGLGGLEDGHL